MVFLITYRENQAKMYHLDNPWEIAQVSVTRHPSGHPGNRIVDLTPMRLRYANTFWELSVHKIKENNIHS